MTVEQARAPRAAMFLRHDRMARNEHVVGAPVIARGWRSGQGFLGSMDYGRLFRNRGGECVYDTSIHVAAGPVDSAIARSDRACGSIHRSIISLLGVVTTSNKKKKRYKADTCALLADTWAFSFDAKVDQCNQIFAILVFRLYCFMLAIEKSGTE